MRNNPNIDLVNINEYIKFGEMLSISSQDIEQKLLLMHIYTKFRQSLSMCSKDIERKRNFEINQRL